MVNAIRRQEVSTIAELNRVTQRRLSSSDVAVILMKLIGARLNSGQIDRKLVSDMRLALKCHPYDVNAAGLHEACITVFNRWAAAPLAPLIQTIHRFVAAQLPVPLIISCEKYMETAIGLRSTLGQGVFPVPPIIIRGDENALEESFKDGILTLPIEDTYEALPLKIFESLSLMSLLGASTGILKIDDDIKVVPGAQIDLNLLRRVLGTSDYIGVRIDSMHHDRAWHFGKCRDAVPTVYGKPYRNPWANGPLYYVSGRALGELAPHYARFPGCIDGELYEDKAVGDTLYQLGIHVLDCPLQNVLKASIDATERLLAPHPAASATASEPPAVAPVPAPPRVVRSFDIFDTLVARRCMEPLSIFALVEQRSGIANFAAMRRQAEERIAHADYDLDAIYRELAAIGRLSEAEAKGLKALEITCELEQIIPIAENILQVRDGDILISDMYLDEMTIRRLLAKAGVARQVDVFVSSAGKSSGRIWPEMARRFAIERHHGDNRHSDVTMPESHGLAVKHTDQSAFTAVESAFVQIGLRDLALLCREARLASWHADAAIRTLQEIQVSLNLPLLLLASVSLVRRAKERGCGRLLFSSRDCNLWVELFPEIARRLGFEGEVEYFYTSRLARTRPSQAYLAYAADRLTPDSIVVDICGTGWSLSHLAEHLGQGGRHNFFLRELPRMDAYEAKAPAPFRCQNHHVIAAAATKFGTDYLEMCNYSDQGMVVDVIREDGLFRPVCAPHGNSAAVMNAIAAQRTCFLDAIALLQHHPLTTTLALDDQAISQISLSLYVLLYEQAPLFDVFRASHTAEDQKVMRELMQSAPRGPNQAGAAYLVA